MDKTREIKSKERKELVRAWLFVWGLALLFLLYGLAMFVIVGDKGPQGWDFNVLEDVPGKSEYSTYPEPGSSPKEPEPQHVAGRPSHAPLPLEEDLK